MIIKGCGLGQKVFEGRFLNNLARHLRPVTRIEIIIEETSIINLFKRIGAFTALCTTLNNFLVCGFNRPFFLDLSFLNSGRRLHFLFQNRVLHQFLGNHFRQFQLVKRQDGYHLH